MYDLIVVGGGIGGLTTAALARHLGLGTALLEAHTKLGGCAGYFQRGPYQFDAGATALVGLRPGEPLRDLLNVLGLDFEGVETPSYRVHLPDRTLDIVAETETFESRSTATFSRSWHSARAQRAFWRLQAAVGNSLLRVAADAPRLPIRGFDDLVQVMGVLGVRGGLAASTSVLTVDNVLGLLGLKSDLAFRSLIAALLQDTAQAGPETVPFANAAACIQAYRLGMSRPRGGMRALAEGIGQRFAERGGDLRTATLVDRIEIEQDPDPSFVVVTRRRERLRARQVALNLPLDLAARLLGRSLEGRLGRLEHQSRAAWSAFTGYLAIDRSAIGDDLPLFHQVLQTYDPPIHDGNNVLISLSPVEDEAYGPPGVRVATMSTHTRPANWQGLDRQAYQHKKADFQARMLAALGQALPGAPQALHHAEFASPRSFQRYTRRTAGAVGGPPVSRSNSNLRAVSPDVLGQGIWLVGDSVFPGQGTLATVLSGIRVVERITGRRWAALRHDRALAATGDSREPAHDRDLSACRAIRQPQP